MVKSNSYGVVAAGVMVLFASQQVFGSYFISTPHEGDSRRTNQNVAGTGTGDVGSAAVFKFGWYNINTTDLDVDVNEIAVQAQAEVAQMTTGQWAGTIQPPSATATSPAGWRVSANGQMPNTRLYDHSCKIEYPTNNFQFKGKQLVTP